MPMSRAEGDSPLPGASPRLLSCLTGVGRSAVFLVHIGGGLPSPRKTVSEKKKMAENGSFPGASPRLLSRLAGVGRGAVFPVHIGGGLPSPRTTVSEKEKDGRKRLTFSSRWSSVAVSSSLAWAASTNAHRSWNRPCVWLGPSLMMGEGTLSSGARNVD